jgi:hypothetical protein
MDKHLIKVIDNFVTPTYSDVLLYDAIHYLQYCYLQKTTMLEITDEKFEIVFQDQNTYDAGQMVCPLFDETVPHGALRFEHYMMFIKPLVCKIIDECVELSLVSTMRAKVNLLFKQETFPDHHYNIPHIDNIHDDKWSAVYYLNDSDGDTVLFNEFHSETLPSKLTVFKKISPKKNRLVIFNSSRYHASSNPRISNERFVINFMLDNK